MQIGLQLEENPPPVYMQLCCQLTNKYKPVHLDQCSQPVLATNFVVNIDFVSCWQLAEAVLVEYAS